MKQNIVLVVFAAVAIAALFTGCPDIFNPKPDQKPTVTSVTITPETAEVWKGQEQCFEAKVEGKNKPSQDVTWSIVVESGKKKADNTSIDADGLLSIADDEALATLTVKAVSKQDTSKSATATVSIAFVGLITNVTITPAAVEVAKGGTQQFAATVIGLPATPPQSVTWKIETEGKKPGTEITAAGLLSVAADEALETLTVIATSTADDKKSGTATVTIAEPEATCECPNGTVHPYGEPCDCGADDCECTEETAPTFSTVAALAAYLATLPDNTASTPYAVKLNVAALPTGGYNSSSYSDLQKALQIANKYVSLDLSDSTFTSIGERTFSYCTSLVSVNIPDSVTSIGGYAFIYCASLASVNIPDSITSIGDNAFWDCTSLASVTIGNGVTSIGILTFASCFSLASITVDSANTAYTSTDGVLYNKAKTALIAYPARKTATSFTMPNSVTSIGDGAFYGCASLASITIPNGVTSIGVAAFSNCTSLASVAIPASVISIWGAAFRDCTSLASITVDPANTAYTATDGVLYNKAKTTLVVYPAGKTGAFTIPASVTSIGQEAFYDCASLESVTIPNSVESIGRNAFDGCTSLASVTIPNSVTSIGYQAFRDCTSLASVTIGSGVTSIGGAAFSGCTNLASVTFEGTISSTDFNTDAFPQMGNLRAKYFEAGGGAGTYTTTSPVSSFSVWTKQP